MLIHLGIQDLAVIDAAQLPLRPGFTVLTGETGAGKSILIDALGLLLGDRADASLIRDGAATAELTAELLLTPGTPAMTWLQAQALADDDEPGQLLLRRVLAREGPSRAFVNGRSVPLASLRELGEQLIEIHGQHQHQQLLKSGQQRALLDAWAAHDDRLAATAQAAKHWQTLSRSIDEAGSRVAVDPAQLDDLRHLIGEIEALDLDAAELPALEDEQRRLAHAGELLQGGNATLDALYGGEAAAYDLLSRIAVQLVRLRELDPGFDEAAQLIDQALIQTEEAAQLLRRRLEHTELDPERLDAVERRMRAIHDLARKHRLRPEELPQRLSTLQDELAAAESGRAHLARLQAEQAEALAAYRKAAAALSASRRTAAERLAGEVRGHLAALGMIDAQLTIAVDTRPGADPAAHGDDDVRIDFSANPGQAPRPLARIASGGELSRVSLAIQVAVSQSASVPVMIFDEVDAGVGGGTAEIVGALLRRLSSSGRQVLCVTHLPQVAAQGNQQFLIRKTTAAGNTRTTVTRLDQPDRVEELARMLGGVEITEATRTLARDMLSRADTAA